MDAEKPEEEFANTAFEILDKNAIVSILVNLDPVTVLSLCQNNTRFADICQDRNIFKRLMTTHYPGFPLADDPKAQYMEIAAGRGTVYYLPILERSPPADLNPRGFPGKYGNVATINNDPKEDYIRFTIFGTRIRKGEKLWLSCRITPNGISASAFLTREDAIQSIPTLSLPGRLVTYLNSRKMEFRKQPEQRRRLGGRVPDVEDPEFIEWLEENDYPYPLTPAGVRNWFEERNYLHDKCNVAERIGKCIWFIIPVTIG